MLHTQKYHQISYFYLIIIYKHIYVYICVLLVFVAKPIIILIKDLCSILIFYLVNKNT